MSDNIFILNKDIIEFDNKQLCVNETNKQKHINIDGPIHVIKTKDDIIKILYPRVQQFHKIRKHRKINITDRNIFNNQLDKLFSNKKLSIYNTNDIQSTYNTLNYVFDEFHTSVFIQILNNKIHTFVLLKNNKSNPDLLKNIKTDPNHYKNKSGIYIKKFEKDWQTSNAPNISFQLINAFPKSVSSLSVSYGESEVLKVTVTMNYDRYIARREYAPVVKLNPLQNLANNTDRNGNYTGTPESEKTEIQKLLDYYSQ